MALLQLAGIDSDILPPKVWGKTYKHTPFDKNEKDISRKRDFINKAWKIVQARAAMGTCNSYFFSLGKKTLLDVLNAGPVTLWILQPVDGHDAKKDVPLANIVGRDIGIQPSLLESGDQSELACTLIHELAHVAGASTNNDKYDPHALDAEKALKHCACGKKYNEKNLGYHILTRNPSKFRIV
jgi:hypothetical protein